MSLSNPQNQSAQEILEKPVSGLLLRLSLPAVVGLLIIGLNNFVDALFVGRLVGAEAVAALSLTWPLGIFVWGFASALGEGGASILSRAIGAGRTEVQQTMLATIIGGALLMGALISPLGWFLADPILALFGASDVVQAMALEYFQIYVLSTFPTVLGVAANMQIRAEGKLHRAMKYAVTSVLINAALTPLFISVFDLGIGGAALATATAMVVYAGINIRFLTSDQSLCQPQLTLSAFRFGQLLRCYALGMATLITNVTGAVQQLLIMGTLVKLGGEVEVAVFGAAWRTMALPVFAVYGLVRALQPILGINFGAGRYDRVRQAVKTFVIAGLTLITALWLPIFLFPREILALTLPDLTLSASQVWQLKVMSLMLPGLPVVFMGMTLFQSLGHARLATGLALCRQLLLFIPAILVLPMLYGVLGVYLSVVVVDVAMVVIVLLFTTRFLKHLEEQELDRRRKNLPPLTETNQLP